MRGGFRGQGSVSLNRRPVLDTGLGYSPLLVALEA